MDVKISIVFFWKAGGGRGRGEEGGGGRKIIAYNFYFLKSNEIWKMPKLIYLNNLYILFKIYTQ